jgi:hypothetical protein
MRNWIFRKGGSALRTTSQSQTPTPENVQKEIADGEKGRKRRAFLSQLGGLATASLAAAAAGFAPAAKAGEVDRRRELTSESGGEGRALQSYNLRAEAAEAERNVPVPFHPANVDEQLYTNRIGNYSKALPHNSIGEVDPSAYNALLQACESGAPSDWNAVPLGGTTKLTDPQAGLAFDMEGTDSHQLAIPAAPAVASAQRAGEMVEDYWMALLRDIPFTSYGQSPLAQSACSELTRLSDFRGPKTGGRVTPSTLFRGFTAGDLLGPYVSQFFLKPIKWGALPITQRYQTYPAGLDYMTDQSTWLAVQNGQGPFAANALDPELRYLGNGRDLAAWVHVDVLYQAYFNACLYLVDNAAPLNPGNPYVNSVNQVGFGTFGAPHIKALVAEVADRALKCVWYQKWFVHRNERPEEFGGLVHMTKTGQATYPLHPDVLHSDAAQRVFTNTGSWFLPMAFPEGCPTHPSYGQGHGTVAGACATVLKAFFDDTALLQNIGDGEIVQPSEDGTSLVSYQGSDGGQLTVGGELNKIAANVALGRNMAGVHWRSDYQESLLLGEAVAISILRDQRPCYNEDFNGFTFHKFDGSQITV